MTILYLIGFILLLVIAFTGLSAAPWVPTRKFDVEALLDDGGVANGKKYTELGCGDGRLVKAAAKRGALAVGYELNPVLFVVAWLSNLGQKKAKIYYRNFWGINLQDSDVVMAFIMPRTLPRLDRKLKRELKSGAIFVSYIFALENKKPIRSGKSWFVYRYK